MTKIIVNKRTSTSGWPGRGPAAEGQAHKHRRSAGSSQVSSALMSTSATEKGGLRPEASPPRLQDAGARASTLMLRNLLRRVIRNDTLTLVTPDGRIQLSNQIDTVPLARECIGEWERSQDLV